MLKTGTSLKVRREWVATSEDHFREAHAPRALYNAPSWQVDARVRTCTAIASNELAPVSSDIATITGTAPHTLATYLRGAI